MHPLRVELYAERYQRQLDSLLQHDLDVITNERNRQFVADTIREVGVTESIRKRFGLENYDTSLTNDQLADTIIGTEAATTKSEYFVSSISVLSQPFIAGYRYLQAIFDNSSTKLAQFNDLLTKVSTNATQLNNIEIICRDLSKIIPRYKQLNTVNIRNNACKYLKQLTELNVLNANHVAILRKQLAELKQAYELIRNISAEISNLPKQNLSASAVYQQSKQLAPTITKALENIKYTNQNYRGFFGTKGYGGGSDWHTSDRGDTTTVMNNAIYYETRIVPILSWRSISKSCSLDMDIVNLLIGNLIKIANRIN